MRRAAFWTAVVLAVAAVFAGSLYAYVGYRETSGPDGAVRGYLAALQRGDAAAALAFGDIPKGSTGFLTDQVLAEQQAIAPMHDAKVLGSEENGVTARVRISYVLSFADGDHRYSATLRVVRHDSTWRLAATAVPVRVDIEQAVDRLNFAGTTVPDGRVLLFPGALPVRFDTKYLRLDRSTRTVQFADKRKLDVRVEPTPSARRLLAAHLRSALRTCTHSSKALACPLPTTRTIPGSLRGKVTGVRCTYRITTEAAGKVDISGNVFFVGTYRTLSYDNVATKKRGRIAIPVSAVAYPVGPLRVHFSDDT